MASKRDLTFIEQSFEGQSFSTISTQRLFFVTHSGDTAGIRGMTTTVLADTAKEHLKEWWTSSSARGAAAALRRAIRGCDASQPSASRVDDLMHFVVGGDHETRLPSGYRRNVLMATRTVFMTGSGLDPGPAEWREDDPSQPASSLKLSHLWRDFEVSSGKRVALELRTLVMGGWNGLVYESPPEQIVSEVFSGRQPSIGGDEILHSERGNWKILTDVLLDGVLISASDLGSLSKPERKAIMAAQRCQILTTLLDCITVAPHWVGGWLSLSHLMMDVAPEENWEVQMLTIDLWYMRAGGRHTEQALSAMRSLADACWHTAEAESVNPSERDMNYKMARINFSNIVEAHEKWPEERLVCCPAETAYRLGVLESRCGDTSAALTAYRRGLAILDAGQAVVMQPVSSFTDETVPQEKLKAAHEAYISVQLISAILCATISGGERPEPGLCRRMFETSADFKRAIRQPGVTGYTVELSGPDPSRLSLVARLHGCSQKWAMVQRFHGGPITVEELPTGSSVPKTRPIRGHQLSEFDDCIPALPRSCCAHCHSFDPCEGRHMKKCGRCGTIYCGKDCQVAHWKEHKPHCKPAEA